MCYFRLVFLGEGMRRREFVALLSGAAIAWPLGARAEQSEPSRQVGVLSSLPETCPRSLEWDAAFRKRLNELGWVDSHNVHLDCRYGAGSVERMRQFAGELVALNPDVLVDITTPATAALQAQTHTIPL